MAKHREKQHNPVDFERVRFGCINFLDEFNDEKDFNAHVKTQETISKENLNDLNQYDLDALKLVVYNDILEQINDEKLYLYEFEKVELVNEPWQAEDTSMEKEESSGSQGENNF